MDYHIPISQFIIFSQQQIAEKAYIIALDSVKLSYF